MTQVRMKNLLRMHIHPNRKGAIRDYEVKQLFLNAKSRRFEFGLEVLKDHFLFFNLDLIAPPFRNLFFTNKMKCPALPVEF